MTLKQTLNIPFDQVEDRIEEHRIRLNQLGKEHVLLNKAAEKYREGVKQYHSGFKGFAQITTSGVFSKYIGIAEDTYTLINLLRKRVDQFNKQRITNQRKENVGAANVAKKTLLIDRIYLYLKRNKEQEIFVHKKQNIVFKAFSTMHKFIKRQFGFFRLLDIVPIVSGYLWLLGATMIFNLKFLGVLAGMGMVVLGTVMLVKQWDNVTNWFSYHYGQTAIAFSTWFSSWTSGSTTLNEKQLEALDERQRQLYNTSLNKQNEAQNINDGVFDYLNKYPPNYAALDKANQTYVHNTSQAEAGNIGNTAIALEEGSFTIVNSTNIFQKNFGGFGGATTSQGGVFQDFLNIQNRWDGTQISFPKFKVVPSETDKAVSWFLENANIGLAAIRLVGLLSGKSQEEVAANIRNAVLTLQTYLPSTKTLRIGQSGIATNDNVETKISNTINSNITTNIEAMDTIGRETHMRKLIETLSSYYTKELYRRDTTLL